MCHSSLHWEESTVIFRWLEGFHFILLASSWVFLRPGYITSYEKCLSNGPNGVPKGYGFGLNTTQKIANVSRPLFKTTLLQLWSVYGFPSNTQGLWFVQSLSDVCGIYLYICKYTILYNIKSTLLLVLIIMYIFIYYNSFSETLAFWLNTEWIQFLSKKTGPQNGRLPFLRGAARRCFWSHAANHRCRGHKIDPCYTAERGWSLGPRNAAEMFMSKLGMGTAYILPGVKPSIGLGLDGQESSSPVELGLHMSVGTGVAPTLWQFPSKSVAALNPLKLTIGVRFPENSQVAFPSCQHFQRNFQVGCGADGLELSWVATEQRNEAMKQATMQLIQQLPPTHQRLL